MKPPTFFSTALACTICLLAFLSCQETHSGMNPLIGENDKIVPRQDCSNCDCSCFVELKDDNAASLELCGTCDGPTAGCMGSGCNETFSGNGHTISLTSTINPRYSFCEDFESVFWIRNTSSTDVANVIISCTADSGTPQTITLTLDPLQLLYINTDDACEVTNCG